MSKIPLFTKDIDIFAHIFWVTLIAVSTAAANTVGYCTALASAMKVRLIDSVGTKMEMEPHQSAARFSVTS